MNSYENTHVICSYAQLGCSLWVATSYFYHKINFVSHQAIMGTIWLVYSAPKYFLFAFLTVRGYMYIGKNRKGYKETINSLPELTEMGNSVWGSKDEKRQGKIIYLECLPCTWHFLDDTFIHIPYKWVKTRLRISGYLQSSSLKSVEPWFKLRFANSKVQVLSTILYYLCTWPVVWNRLVCWSSPDWTGHPEVRPRDLKP